MCDWGLFVLLLLLLFICLQNCSSFHFLSLLVFFFSPGCVGGGGGRLSFIRKWGHTRGGEKTHPIDTEPATLRLRNWGSLLPAQLGVQLTTPQFRVRYYQHTPITITLSIHTDPFIQYVTFPVISSLLARKSAMKRSL